MAAHAHGTKLAPADLVSQIYDTVAAGGYEVIGDDLTAGVKAGLSGAIDAMYPGLPTTSIGATT